MLGCGAMVCFCDAFSWKAFSGADVRHGFALEFEDERLTTNDNGEDDMGFGRNRGMLKPMNHFATRYFRVLPSTRHIFVKSK